MDTPRRAAPTTVGPHARRVALRGAAALACAALLPRARALAAPGGTVVLTLAGRIDKPNDGQRAQFDMPMLQALPQTAFATHTPWFALPRRFSGPLLRDVLAAAGARGTTLQLTALNDYRVAMPAADAERHDVIVACLLDGQPMGVRDKGPLFVVYNFDAHSELRSAVYYGRSAWQLRTIDVA